MIHLSVNINKVALIRNSRGTNKPDVIKVAIDCESFGAQGITLHPRPDQRHARYSDVKTLKKVLKTELNVEGNPVKEFMDVVLDARPRQVTLVPDAPDVLTSNQGWDTIKHAGFLSEVIQELKAAGIRTSIFIDTDIKMVEAAAKTGTDRIELYTEPYAANFHADREKAIAPYIKAANVAREVGLGINAGHDLDLENLGFLARRIPFMNEVSIGHALICDALYHGLENTIQLYLRQLKVN